MARPFSPLEFALVVGIAFGQFSLYSIAVLLGSGAGEGGSGVLFGRSHLLRVLTYELTVAPIIVLLLHRTGWRLRHFGGVPEWEDAGRAAALFVASYVVFYVSGIAATLVQAADVAPTAHRPGLPLLAAASLVNGSFEEMLVCGYVVCSLIARFGPISAINVSTAIRVSYHLYQGPFAFVWVGMFGLLFCWAFLRWGRIWPLVCAHVLLDFVALGAYG